MQVWDTIPLWQRQAFLSACSSENLTSVEILTDTLAEVTITLGNTIDKASIINSLAESLRHALLTQVQGCAMTHLSLKLRTFTEEKASSEIILHRYARLEGIVETVREIISNFQKVVFRLDSLPNYAGKYLFKHDQESEFQLFYTAGDLERREKGLSVINPDLVLFHCQSRPFELSLVLEIRKGTGYLQARDHDLESDNISKNYRDISFIPIDADFNPVERVGLNDPCGKDKTNLVLTIQTKGNVTPSEAYYQAVTYLINKT